MFIFMLACMHLDKILACMKRPPPEKRALVLLLVSEGTPINAVCRIPHMGKHTVLRVIEEMGEAMADYMDRTFRNLCVDRLALDEAWHYVARTAWGWRNPKRRGAISGYGPEWIAIRSSSLASS